MYTDTLEESVSEKSLCIKKSKTFGHAWYYYTKLQICCCHSVCSRTYYNTEEVVGNVGGGGRYTLTFTFSLV